MKLELRDRKPGTLSMLHGWHVLQGVEQPHQLSYTPAFFSTAFFLANHRYDCTAMPSLAMGS